MVPTIFEYPGEGSSCAQAVRYENACAHFGYDYATWLYLEMQFGIILRWNE